MEDITISIFIIFVGAMAVVFAFDDSENRRDL